MNYFKRNFSTIIFLLSYFTLIISFFLNEDGTGRGTSGDFEVTYGFILALQENLLADPKDWTLVHTPLHFIILSLIEPIFSNPYYLRLFYCLISIILPYLLFKIINNYSFKDSEKNYALIISSIIFFLPAFRYSAIWANDLITSLIFFFIFNNFFLRNGKLTKINI